MKRLKGWLSNQGGTTLVIAAVAMVPVLGAAALAVDVGMLLEARAQSQRTADGSALAGASWLQVDPDDEAGARDKAQEYATLNPVRGIIPNLLPEDVDVILADGKVRVRIQNLAARGTAIPTIFARIFGISTVDVATVAAAEWLTSGGITFASGDCPLPLSMIDDFIDGEPKDSIWSGSPPDYYDPGSTGFNESDYGELYELKVDGNKGGGPLECRHEVLDLCNAFEDSWHCWYLDEETAQEDCGVGCIGPRIYPAEVCGPGLSIGETIYEASGAGNKQSMVHTDYNTGGVGSFADLINNDPYDLQWHEGKQCVVSGITSPLTCYDGESPRLRDIPLVDPTTLFCYCGNNN